MEEQTTSNTMYNPDQMISMTAASLKKRGGTTGFSLYLRFPTKLNADRQKATDFVKKLDNRILNVRFPRQKSAQFCLVDYRTEADCLKSKKLLQKIKIKRKRVIIKLPTWAKKEVLDNKIEKLEKHRACKSALDKLIFNIKRSMKHNYLVPRTNGICIKNIPKTINETDVKKLFPEAIEYRMMLSKQPNRPSTAYFTLPTHKDAKRATKMPVKLNGKRFKVAYQKDEPERKHNNIKSNDEVKTEIEIKTEDEIKEEINEIVPSGGRQNTSKRYYQTADKKIKTEEEEETPMKIYN